jgi:hypothetical protein
MDQDIHSAITNIGAPCSADGQVANSKRTKLGMSDKVVISIFAIDATLSGLLLAAFVGGQIARAWFGVPVGFREHFTSSIAQRQALLAQIACVGLAFLLLGIAFGRTVRSARFAWTVWAANPITVGVGFAIYKLVYQSLPLANHDIEYFSLRNGVLLSTVAPLVFAFCFFMGEHLFGMEFRKSHGS